MQDALEVLEKYWGFASFRGRQEEIICSVLEKKDTLALLPTGGGKSICFQVPALMMDGMCLVISPLIALMKDQVFNLHNKGITALSLHSGMGYYEVRKTMQDAASGHFKFLYVSPERLETALFREYLPAFNINLIAVDEAHCVSQWGYDFRPPYLRIAGLRDELPEVPLLALTASATKLVQEDIVQKLRFATPNIFRQSFERPNISYSVFKVNSKINKLVEILNNVPGSSIVYCTNRNMTQEVSQLLASKNINADFYHAGLLQEERSVKQENWINNKTRVIVSTNAFGMGIDKADVRTVVHYDIPDCLENYYQESGRAGRDEKKAYGVLLCNPEDEEMMISLPAKRFPSVSDIKKVYQSLADHLEIPVGLGEGNFYDFDLNAFVKNFKIDIFLVMNSIKALEQEGYLHFDENIFLPSQVNFITEKKLLHDFENNHPQLEPLIKYLLRTYSGIIDNRVSVSEKQIAKQMRCSATTIKEALQKLKAYGIIEYLPQKETPQIHMLTNRAPAKFLNINYENYLKRKMQYHERVQTMLQYIRLEKDCRSIFIGKYFNDTFTNNCGICDNCLKQKKTILKEDFFTQLQQEILEKATEEKISLKELLGHFGNIKKEHFWKAMEYLQKERMITIDDRGIIKRNV